MRHLLNIAGAGVLMVAHAIAMASTLRLLWGWFLSPQYGAGPSLAAWYGASTIFGLSIGLALSGYGVKSEERTFAKSCGGIVGGMIGMLLVIGMCWCVGSVLGWL